MRWTPGSEVGVSTRLSTPTLIVRPELVRKRELSGVFTSSESESDEEPAIRRPSRAGLHSGILPLRIVKRPATSASGSMDDDPCGIRRKRTFFRSAGEGTVIPPLNGLLGVGFGGVGLGDEKAKSISAVEIGLGSIGVPVAEGWRDGVSRGGSPVSVM